MAEINVTVTGQRGYKLRPFECPNCGHGILITALQPTSDGYHEIGDMLDTDLVPESGLHRKAYQYMTRRQVEDAVVKVEKELADVQKNLRVAGEVNDRLSKIVAGLPWWKRLWRK